MGFVQYINRPAPFEAIPTWLFKDGQAGGFWLPRPTVRGRNQLYQDAAGTALAAPGDPVGLLQDISPNGNHLSQSVSGSRPVLVREPEGGRRNLLTWTDDFRKGWTGRGVGSESSAFIRDYAIAPDGTKTAVRFHPPYVEDPGGSTRSFEIYRGINSPAGDKLTFSVFVKPVVATGTYYRPENDDYIDRDVWLSLHADHVSGAFFNLHTKEIDKHESVTAARIEDVGDGWLRCSISFVTQEHDSTRNHFINFCNRAVYTNRNFDPYPNGTEDIYIWGIQLERGLEPTPYQRVTNNHDTFEQGKAHHTYLKLDKVDDNLSVTLPDAVNGTMLLATRDGIVHADVDIPAGEWSITANPQFYPGDTLVGLILRDGHMNEQELQAAREYLISIGAGADQFAGVKSMENWFRQRSDLVALHAGDWDTSQNTRLFAFSYLSSLTEIDVSGWDTSKVVTLNAFMSSTPITTLDVSNWDTSSATSFRSFVQDASSLHTVIVNGGTSNPFADSPCTDYVNAFTNTNLSQQSIDDILVAIEKAGTSNGTFDQSGGSAPSAVGEAAIDKLLERGWTINVTGGYTNAVAEIRGKMFAGGADGALFIPKPEYLYQDAAGTTPVTADGDPVGLMLDLSGNDNHATQAVSGARPVYRTDGQYHRLEFDGVDDALTAGDVMDVGSGSLMQAAAFTRASSAQNAVMGKSWTGTDSGRYFLVTRGLDAVWYDQDSYSIRDLAWQPGRTYVAAQVVNRVSSGTHAFRRDGVEESLVAGLPSGSVENDLSFHIGFYPSSYARHMGPFFGGVVVIRENDFTERDVQIVERYLASLAGVTLDD